MNAYELYNIRYSFEGSMWIDCQNLATFYGAVISAVAKFSDVKM
jgi:hypothetical protein